MICIFTVPISSTRCGSMTAAIQECLPKPERTIALNFAGSIVSGPYLQKVHRFPIGNLKTPMIAGIDWIVQSKRVGDSYDSLILMNGSDCRADPLWLHASPIRIALFIQYQHMSSLSKEIVIRFLIGIKLSSFIGCISLG